MSSPVPSFESLDNGFSRVCLEQVISQLSRAIITAIPASHPRHPLLRGMLLGLAKWETRPRCLREMSYKWCSAICKGYQGLEDGEELLFASLRVGFRGLDVQYRRTVTGLVHTRHHRYVGDIVFNSGDDEVIADLLQAWTSPDRSHTSYHLLNTWPQYVIRLRRVVSTSQRLRRLVIRSVELLGPQQVRQVGVEEFTALLDCLRVGTDDMDSEIEWLQLLLYVVQLPEGRRTLPYPYWELIVELVVDKSWFRRGDPIDYDLQVMLSLQEEEEWDMLECWSGFIWFLRCPKVDTMPEDLECTMLSLFRQRPGAVEKLERWIQRSSMPKVTECLECLQWICERGGLDAASRQDSP